LNIELSTFNFQLSTFPKSVGSRYKISFQLQLLGVKRNTPKEPCATAEKLTFFGKSLPTLNRGKKQKG